MSGEIQKQPERMVQASDVSVVNTGHGISMVPEDMNQAFRFAEMMSNADVAIPKHLRKNSGACLAVTMQAMNWEMDPFAVANKSYSVSDRLAYEAQLIAAVVNTRSGIKGRLKYDYQGEGVTLVCIVSGELDGETHSYTSPMLSEIITQNSPLWKSDPRQQLGYYSARNWARRHVPEVILGVYDREEAAAMKDVTPQQSKVAKMLQDAPDKSEGFGTVDVAAVGEAKSEPEQPDTPAQEPTESDTLTQQPFDLPDGPLDLVKEYAVRLYACTENDDRAGVRDEMANEFADSSQPTVDAGLAVENLTRAIRDGKSLADKTKALDDLLAATGMTEIELKAGPDATQD